MAAEGYGVRTTWLSIFEVDSDMVNSTRFGHINVDIGRKFNFYLTGDSETDITETTVTGMLVAETHQLIYELYIRANASKPSNPWMYMPIELNLVDFKERFKDLIKKAQNILYESMEVSIGDLKFGW